MKENLFLANKAINNLVNDVTRFVKQNGGFINTQNNDGACDQIYAYVVDWYGNNVNEERVIAVRTTDGVLEIATNPMCKANYSNGLKEEDIPTAEWYEIDGDSILTAQTILSIADSINQYI